MSSKFNYALSVRNLSFSYESGEVNRGRAGGRGLKGRKVLEIASLDIHSGGCHAVLGPNGCGKTTLLKLAAGLLEPSFGSVSCGGGAVLVHQHPYLLSTTVFSNVAYGLKIRKTPKEKIKKRVNAELERWGLSSLAARHASKLSGGERQRTAIARAMVLKPDILLLDEPTASVDPENISQMESLITGIINSGTTVILSTHHMDFAYRMADTIVRLKQGKPVEPDENIVIGTVSGRDESLNLFNASGTVLHCPGRDGEFRRAVFSMNDVILSSEPVVSSARNVLEADIIALEKSGADVIVFLRAGFSFKARVSSVSAKALGLISGHKIYALLKSSSISLY